MKMLTFMLAACGETRKIYESLQISETIFLDTMKCFPRFINDRDSRRASYAMARDFLKELFPAYQNAPFLCTSWLLSPGLKECLPRTSRIRSFQEDFVITETFPERMDFLTWVYKRPDIPLEELPENTSLQRELKRYLLKGGTVGEAAGVLSL